MLRQFESPRNSALRRLAGTLRSVPIISSRLRVLEHWVNVFLSYCTATECSPAEAQPLTSRAMLLLMPESTISLITVIAGVARAINILAS